MRQSYCPIVPCLLVLDVAVLDEVLVALLLLLGLVVRGVGGVAALVVAVVALDRVVVLGLLDHHHLWDKHFRVLQNVSL